MLPHPKLARWIQLMHAPMLNNEHTSKATSINDINFFIPQTPFKMKFRRNYLLRKRFCEVYETFTLNASYFLAHWYHPLLKFHLNYKR